MPVVGEDLEQVLQSVEQKLAELKEVFLDEITWLPTPLACIFSVTFAGFHQL